MPSTTDRGVNFTGTAVDTNGGGVTLTIAAVTGKAHFLTDIDVSGDAAALVTVESPASTVLWSRRASAAFSWDRSFHEAIRGAVGQALLVKISASTTNSEANAQGRTI